MNIEEIRDYCLSKPYVSEDMPFGDDYITFRVGNKIFCGLPLTKKSVVQLKWDPNQFDEIVEKYSYVCQAWHWHKRHMIQFNLDEYPIPNNIVKTLIDTAFQYVYNRLPQKIKATLRGSL